MRRVLLLCIVCLMPLALSAEQAAPNGQWDGTIIDPQQSAWYYGELQGEPHSYMLYLDEPLDARFDVYVPATDDESPLHAAIIVKQATRGVEEVARLSAESASWERFFDVPTGRRYRHGGSYHGRLESGIYTVEVHSPVNQGQYVLRFGDAGSLSSYSYLGKLGRLVSTNQLQGRPMFAVLYSPYLYVPLLGLLALCYFWWRRKYHA